MNDKEPQPQQTKTPITSLSELLRGKFEASLNKEMTHWYTDPQGQEEN